MSEEKPELLLTTPDSIGYVPDLSLVNTRWTHSGNGYTYMIMGYIFNGENDRWMLLHQRYGSNYQCCRTPENFFGNRSNGEVRYTRVQ